MDLIKVKSAAKINIGLEIIGRREDGYHSIRSIFQEIDLCDHLTIKKSESFQFTCSDPTVPTNDSNTVVKAYRLLADKISPVNIHLEKRIPHQAGLGGGSSNAAATLNALNHLFELNLDQKTLLDYAAEIGSDVPFFIEGGQALITGRGEIIERIEFPFPFSIVLLKPDIAFSTADIYKNYQTYLDDEQTDHVNKFLQSKDKESLQALSNDLEKAIDHPQIDQLKQHCLDHGAFYAAMTGSGSAVFALFDQITNVSEIDGVKIFYTRPLQS